MTQTQADARPPMTAEVLATAPAEAWRRPDPAHTLYLELESGRVVIELAPQFAPRHTANIVTMVKAGYFDGLAILRVQENYVVQWGDPRAGDADHARPLGKAHTSLPPEFTRPAEGLAFVRLADGDVYAPQVGHADGFPAARDPKSGLAWMAHCYGAVGVSRGNTADSGSGASLYVVIGHAPRHLDRNITVVGRVLQGMEHLSSLPRGSGPLGFYQEGVALPPVHTLRLAGELPAAERSDIEVMRTDTASFAAWTESRRARHEDWFLDPVGRVELCNVGVPVRATAR
jgi:peptidylprolyl isomerase